MDDRETHGCTQEAQLLPREVLLAPWKLGSQKTNGGFRGFKQEMTPHGINQIQTKDGTKSKLNRFMNNVLRYHNNLYKLNYHSSNKILFINKEERRKYDGI